MKKLILVSVLCLLASITIAQDSKSCACCTDNHSGFDFWEGDWNVFDTLGNQIGQNTIIKLEDNCILQETWRGGSGSNGSSYNYFNRQDSTWNQLWIDNSGNQLILKGHASENKMTMESELIPGKKIDFYKNQIVWTANIDGSVTQTWNILSKENKLLQTVFTGIYKRKSNTKK